MEEKLTIWFLGSNATGKTTQCAKIHLMFREMCDTPDFVSEVREFIVDDIKYSYTKVSPISANLGVFNHPLTSASGIKTNDCCGTDKLSTKAQIVAAYVDAISDPDIKVVTVDAIMATGQFIEFLRNDESKLLTVLLDCSENTNFKRLAERRGKKAGINPSEVILAEKTQENLSTKLKNFRRTFEKAAVVSDHSLAISTDISGIEEVFELVQEAILYSI